MSVRAVHLISCSIRRIIYTSSVLIIVSIGQMPHVGVSCSYYRSLDSMSTYSRQALRKLNNTYDHIHLVRTVWRRFYCLCLSTCYRIETAPNRPAPTGRLKVPSVQAGLRLGQINSRSVTRRIAVLHDTIHDHNLDLIGISEIWIRDGTRCNQA